MVLFGHHSDHIGSVVVANVLVTTSWKMKNDVRRTLQANWISIVGHLIFFTESAMKTDIVISHVQYECSRRSSVARPRLDATTEVVQGPPRGVERKLCFDN